MAYKAKREKEKKETKKGKKILKIVLAIFLLGVLTVGFLLYGPYSGFRDWLITVSMTSMTHQWIAKMLYPDDVIQQVLNNNRVDEVKEDTNINEVQLEPVVEEKQYANEYEKQILDPNLKEKENDIYKNDKDYRIINIKGKGYTGYLAAVYDPSKIQTLVTSRLGTTGQYLKTMAKNNNAKLAINGGKFYDPKYRSNGATPRGVTYVKGKCVTAYSYRSTGGIIGFNKDNVLVLSSTCTKSNAKKLNIRDCVTCGPFLIVNGKASKVVGNGGWGTAPRTAIGQRKDGVVLWLVIDGRKIGRAGADMDDLIEIMQRYGAYTAANLDGGTSSVMAVDGELINDPIDSTGAHKTRFIATGFGLIDK